MRCKDRLTWGLGLEGVDKLESIFLEQDFRSRRAAPARVPIDNNKVGIVESRYLFLRCQHRAVHPIELKWTILVLSYV